MQVLKLKNKKQSKLAIAFKFLIFNFALVTCHITAPLFVCVRRIGLNTNFLHSNFLTIGAQRSDIHIYFGFLRCFMSLLSFIFSYQ
jgi:hypothetical protein